MNLINSKTDLNIHENINENVYGEQEEDAGDKSKSAVYEADEAEQWSKATLGGYQHGGSVGKQPAKLVERTEKKL